MRIIAGKYKSRRIPDSKLRHTRPTTDFARTGLFSMIEHRSDLTGIHALDLFAGTGSIGFELLSRGCERVTMIDNDRYSIIHLKKTTALLQDKKADVIQTDVIRFLKSCRPVYQLIIADPPFDYGNDSYKNLIELTLKNALAAQGLFILEHQATVQFSGHNHFMESRRFGNVAFSFFAETIES
jgi:16S rRNA (guanine(966)-N(2))-methyltransferase RsmD